MDIVIYTNPETLLDKRRPDFNCWWAMKRLPKNLQIGDRIYFAVKGEIQGSFKFDCLDYERDEREVICFKSDSWEQADEYADWIFCKPFRGFRYKWWKDKDN